jgi:hypothetical protein
MVISNTTYHLVLVTFFAVACPHRQKYRKTWAGMDWFFLGHAGMHCLIVCNTNHGLAVTAQGFFYGGRAHVPERLSHNDFSVVNGLLTRLGSISLMLIKGTR